MARLRHALMVVAALALLCLPVSAGADTTVKAKLMALNNSGATGTATLTAMGDGGLRVVIRAEGLVPGVPHAQHLHGSANGGHFGCPTLAANDSDGDGYLTNEEATGEYGTIFFPLTTRGGVTATPKDALDAKRMPVADRKGRIRYERTFRADQLPKGLLENLSSLHVVLHGIDVNNNDTYDVDALGVSAFAKSLGVAGVPEEATNPASCGVVRGVGAAEHAHHGVEAGGAPETGLSLPLVAGGGALLLVSGALLVARRRGRSATRARDDAEPAADVRSS